ncbi:probable serine/threonine-protein kinase DDB_G0291918 [Fagus crenata]
MMNEEDNNNNDQEINRMRNLNNQDFQFQSQELEEQDDFDLDLSLSIFGRPLSQSPPLPPPPTSPQPLPLSPPPSLPFAETLAMPALYSQTPSQFPFQLSPSHPLYVSPFIAPAPPLHQSSTSTPLMYPPQETTMVPSRPVRSRRNPTQVPREGRSPSVPALFPWATTHRATVHDMNYLQSKQIVSITGEVQCKRCERTYEMEFNLKEKFDEVGLFIWQNKSSMRDRAPGVWLNPVLPTCRFCEQENSAKPIIADKKKAINWLFLLLGQMLGCCTLEQLKYFCKHTRNHRTGAKDRVLYLTYLALCKQLDPNGPFDR